MAYRKSKWKKYPHHTKGILLGKKSIFPAFDFHSSEEINGNRWI